MKCSRKRPVRMSKTGESPSKARWSQKILVRSLHLPTWPPEPQWEWTALPDWLGRTTRQMSVIKSTIYKTCLVWGMIVSASSRIDGSQYVIYVVVLIISAIQTFSEVTTVGHLLPSGFNRAVHICSDQQACDEGNQEALREHGKNGYGESFCGRSCWIIHV